MSATIRGPTHFSFAEYTNASCPILFVLSAVEVISHLNSVMIYRSAILAFISACAVAVVSILSFLGWNSGTDDPKS